MGRAVGGAIVKGAKTACRKKMSISLFLHLQEVLECKKV